MFSSLQLFLFFKSIMDTTKDWQFGKTLPDRINYMLQNQLMCDVTFHVGANENQSRRTTLGWQVQAQCFIACLMDQWQRRVTSAYLILMPIFLKIF
jgi:hypothetical protein